MISIIRINTTVKYKTVAITDMYIFKALKIVRILTTNKNLFLTHTTTNEWGGGGEATRDIIPVYNLQPTNKMFTLKLSQNNSIV